MIRWRFGQWLCRFGIHKRRRYYERDWGIEGYDDTFDCCERCGFGPL